MSTVALLSLASCDGSAGGGGERSYTAPAEVKIALAPGERVICEVSSSRFGFPVASPPGASIYFWGRHRFECHVEPAIGPIAPATGPVAPAPPGAVKPAKGKSK